MAITLYGITNCDTMKIARAWLDKAGVAYALYDYKKAGVDRAILERWVAEHGWETILNRAGTTFRTLPEAKRTALDANAAIALMLAQPAMIKRPILETGTGRTLVGFKADRYRAAIDAAQVAVPFSPTRR